jgi:predicted acylesterase/phospholipase RssA
LDRWPAWPLDRISALETPRSDRDRPTISLLFSGGVFRGVYLAGVINGLNEVRVQPDVIAGSSIGSITAAMAARVFAVDVNDVSTRQRRILDVAATYLAVDRLVLTDRFSDFVRNFTLRSAAATFSLRSLDRAFRAFDRTTSDKFGRDVRRVLAGLERLFYVSPFEAHDLIRAFRLRDYHQARLLIEAYSREWLERGAVGVELLGAEPLAILIREHVLDGTSGRAGDPAAGFVDLLRDKGIQFICTATNLTRGRLDTLHIPSIDNAGDGTRLVEALLASSAFPGVFRPRWSWELRPEAENVEQYIDGGVMDNLPLDAVASFLNTARNARRVRARPRASGDGVPHLLFTGSLEIASPTMSDDEASELTRSWRRTRKRSKELTYNNKIDNYAKAQHALRRIYTSADSGQRRYEPLDLEVVAVKPQWLCGTFAFHPMLGFRRADQAKSIAHGCKTTLKQFATLSNEHADWLAAWNVAAPQSWHDEPDSASKAKGHCWYRKGCVCPFSDQGISGAGGEPIKLETRRELRTIYEWCGKASTHERDP